MRIGGKLSKIYMVEVSALGGKGDGLARTESGEKLFIPFALSGETVRAVAMRPRGDGIIAKLQEVINASPSRIEPFCPYYQRCGGCTMQHLALPDYREWKRGQLQNALARMEKSHLVGELLEVPPNSRRRAAFAFSKQGKNLCLGFNALASEEIIEIASCPLILEKINALLSPLRGMLSKLLPGKAKGDAVINITTSGIDLWLDCQTPLDLEKREFLANFAESYDLARLSWGKEPEPLAERRAPRLTFGTSNVAIPPGAFLQPSEEGERIIVEHVRNWVGEAKSVVDLFAGCGSLGLSLSDNVRLHAVEGEAALIEALQAGARHSGRGSLVSIERRDLVRKPLTAAEMERFEVVIFDPPRPGAAAQAREIAKTKKPKTVIAISCNPATFAHDAFLLSQGGWVMAEVLPLDQFPFTPHLEVMAVFRRK
jgi:23S rRNA (uracil1939-C5)-methyltransferase